MAVRSLARSGVGTGGKYISFLAGNAAFSPDSDFLIEEQVLASTASSITFTSIPSTYKHLQLRMVSKTNRANTNDNIYLRFNSDSGSNYAYHTLNGTGSVVSSSGAATQAEIGINAVGNSVTSGVFSTQIVDILDAFATSKNKTIRALMGKIDSANSVYRIDLTSGVWLSTAAITSMTLVSGTGSSFVVGSRFSLYGSNG